MNRTTPAQLTLCLMLTALMSCAATAPVPSRLEPSAWQLKRVTPATTEEVRLITSKPGAGYQLYLEQDRIRLENGCNRAQGTYTQKGHEIFVSDMVSTLMACSDPNLMSADEVMMDVLRQAGTMPAVMRDGALVFRASGFEVEFESLTP